MADTQSPLYFALNTNVDAIFKVQVALHSLCVGAEYAVFAVKILGQSEVEQIT